MRLQGVGRRYRMRGPWVLRDIDLDVPGRALLRIEGSNGTGKSTLLRLLAGIDTPTAGRITGRPRAAYVPERFAATLPFDSAGYLTHIGRVHGLSGPEAARRSGHWLERFAMTGYATTPLDRLSKGTAQKVAVAQALLAEPDLLVLDEAWTGLDAAARGMLDEAVMERVGAGAAVVFVDHDPRRLAGAGARVHRVVEDGRLLEAGSAAIVPQVVIEAEGAGELPAMFPRHARMEARSPHGTLLITLPTDQSDAALRALLAAEPPWHIRAVRPAVPTGGGAAHGGEAR